MVMIMKIMAVCVVMPHSLVEFNSKMEAAVCSEMLGEFLLDDMASHHSDRNICHCDDNHLKVRKEQIPETVHY